MHEPRVLALSVVHTMSNHENFLGKTTVTVISVQSFSLLKKILMSVGTINGIDTSNGCSHLLIVVCS